MTDVATTAILCVATGAIAAPVCALIGFDPAPMIGAAIGGFLGCIIVQTLLPSTPEEKREFLALAKLTVGSVLLAGMMTLGFAPWATRVFGLESTRPEVVNFLMGGAVGAFAQPILVLLREKFLRRIATIGEKEGSRNV